MIIEKSNDVVSRVPWSGVVAEIQVPHIRIKAPIVAIHVDAAVIAEGIYDIDSA